MGLLGSEAERVSSVSCPLNVKVKKTKRWRRLAVPDTVSLLDSNTLQEISHLAEHVTATKRIIVGGQIFTVQCPKPL